MGYTSILTNTKIIKIRLGILIKSFMFIIRSFVFTAPIIRLKFFHTAILTYFHCFCLHQDLPRFPALTSASTVSMPWLWLFVLFYLIPYEFLSPTFWSCTVLAIPSQEEWFRSLQTCVSHICAVLFFYIPIISLTMVHRFGKHLSSVARVLMGNICIIFPALMNRIIYSEDPTDPCQDLEVVLHEREGNILNQKLVSFRKLLAKKESILNIKTLYNMPLSCEKFQDLWISIMVKTLISKFTH